MKVNIPKDFIKTIKNQAISSEEEIYGWLIGYQYEDEPNILSIFECQKFEQQTLISAIPHAEEFQEISSVLPQGIGPIGIYHSHPASSKVFHSHADDSTLLSLSRQFPNSISIVTNGSELNCYQMDDEDITHNIEMDFNKPKVPKFFLISIDEELHIKVHSYYLNSEKKDKLRIKVVNSFRVFFEDIWDNVRFFHRNDKIKRQKVSKLSVNNLSEPPITIRFAKRNNSINENKYLRIIPEQFDLNKIDEKEFKSFNIKIKARIPIYFTKSTQTFVEFKPLIKTELISNNILQKLYHSYIDYNSQTILLPEDIFLNFFGFFIKIMLFPDDGVRNNKLRDKTNKFLLKIISQIQSLTKIDLSKTTKNYIQFLIKNIKKIAQTYNLKETIIQKLEVVQ
jgi:proteasome lid subunit RPN8/RPN11